jgi:hypothetical protein
MYQASKVEAVAQAAVVEEEEAEVDTMTERAEVVAEAVEEAEDRTANASITAAVEMSKIATTPQQNMPS